MQLDSEASRSQSLAGVPILTNEVSGVYFVLKQATESYFGLDEAGTRMWSALTTSDSIQRAYDQRAYEILLAEYDVDADVLHRDLSNLIENLAAKGLVEVNES